MGITIKVDDDELQTIFDYLIQMKSNDSFVDFLELSIESPDLNTGYVTFDMREPLMGNPIFRTLQGGIIATVLDIVGGHVAFLTVFKRVKGAPFEKQIKHVSKVATIDLRVDYLQPGKGERFTAKGWILRAGNKVAVIRMELHNEMQVLIAVGTGTYSVG